jgi:uracil-DNA glycosylase
MKRSQDEARAALASIAEEVVTCRLCPLAETRTRAVPGEGRAGSRVALVGEAPGKEEDLTGRPFVGRGGKLLDSVLKGLGQERAGVYITNIVKCRPPRNRVPKRIESETCVEAHLKGELEALGPKVVVLLGRTASRSIQGASTLKEVRGKLIRRAGVTYLSTYHPAAILRNPGLRPTFEQDLRSALAASRPRRRK